jgi:hypothetical protein
MNADRHLLTPHAHLRTLFSDPEDERSHPPIHARGTLSLPHFTHSPISPTNAPTPRSPTRVQMMEFLANAQDLERGRSTPRKERSSRLGTPNPSAGAMSPRRTPRKDQTQASRDEALANMRKWAEDMATPIISEAEKNRAAETAKRKAVKDAKSSGAEKQARQRVSLHALTCTP